MRYLFLPPEYRKDFQKTYVLRLSSLYVVGIGIVCLIGITLKVPSYLATRISLESSTKSLRALESTTGVNESSKVSTEAKEADKLIKVFANASVTVPIQDVIGAITSKVDGSIALTSILIPNVMNSSTTIALTGKASTRDALLGFKKNLEADIRVVSVGLPVSDLTKNKDIDFTMQVRIDFAKKP